MSLQSAPLKTFARLCHRRREALRAPCRCHPWPRTAGIPARLRSSLRHERTEIPPSAHRFCVCPAPPGKGCLWQCCRTARRRANAVTPRGPSARLRVAVLAPASSRLGSVGYAKSSRFDQVGAGFPPFPLASVFAPSQAPHGNAWVCPAASPIGCFRAVRRALQGLSRHKRCPPCFSVGVPFRPATSAAFVQRHAARDPPFIPRSLAMPVWVQMCAFKRGGGGVYGWFPGKGASPQGSRASALAVHRLSEV